MLRWIREKRIYIVLYIVIQSIIYRINLRNLNYFHH